MIGVDETGEHQPAIDPDIFEAMLADYVNDATKQGKRPSASKIQEMNLRYQDRASKKSDLQMKSLVSAHNEHHAACSGRLSVWASLPTNRGSGLIDYVRIGMLNLEDGLYNPKFWQRKPVQYSQSD